MLARDERRSSARSGGMLSFGLLDMLAVVFAFLPLYGVNDTTADAEISFAVKNITEDGRLVLEGEALLPADASTRIGELKLKDGEKNFYLIEWQKEGRTHRNHYFTNIIDIDYDAYLKALEKCGFDEFEGF